MDCDFSSVILPDVKLVKMCVVCSLVFYSEVQLQEEVQTLRELFSLKLVVITDYKVRSMLHGALEEVLIA